MECIPIIFKTMFALAPPSLYGRFVALDGGAGSRRGPGCGGRSEYEEAETMARGGMAWAEAPGRPDPRGRVKGIRDGAGDWQLRMTRDSVQQWKEAAQAARFATTGPAPDTDGLLLTALEEEMTSTGKPAAPPAG